MWALAAIAVCAGAAWLGLRIEPHIASKDGRRFLCMGQMMNLQGDPLQRWRETRVIVNTRDELHVHQRKFMRKPLTTYWRLDARSPSAPRRKQVYLLRGHDAEGVPVLLALKLPSSSRAVAVMDALLERRPS